MSVIIACIIIKMKDKDKYIYNHKVGTYVYTFIPSSDDPYLIMSL